MIGGRKYVVGCCPHCGRPVVYSDNPKDKDTAKVIAADESYKGRTQLCSKCKNMFAIIEKPKVAAGFVAIPIVSAIV